LTGGIEEEEEEEDEEEDDEEEKARHARGREPRSAGKVKGREGRATNLRLGVGGRGRRGKSLRRWDTYCESMSSAVPCMGVGA
jgi:hypothetical protein